MTSDIGVRTWEDLARKILEMAPEERKRQIQVVTYNTDSDAVHALEHGVCFASIGELELHYTRSSIDNKHHDEHFVLVTDGNPFTEKGIMAYRLLMDDEPDPVGVEGYDPVFRMVPDMSRHEPSMDWTGPAQKLRDEELKAKE